jgi:Fe-S cluster biosynthesis and repair protein YggX/urease gamma subunit
LPYNDLRTFINEDHQETRIMSETNERIERFKTMADADPQNELGHFSLGRALIDAGRFAEAIEPLRRATAINSNLSKAYQLVAQCLLKENRQGEAVATLTQGVRIADARGDVMPRNEMVEMLKTLGAAVPEIKTAPAQAVAVGEGQVLCKRCGKLAPKLPSQPMRSELGKLVYENVCAPCWREAIGMGTKVINELRLDLSDPRAQTVWDQNIREFLNLT